MKLCYPVTAPGSSAPVMSFRGDDCFAENLRKISEIGYQGIELLVRDAAVTDPDRIRSAAARFGLEIAAVGSSPVSAKDRLTLLSENPEIREKAFQRAEGLLELAGAFGVPMNIGKFRGNVKEEIPGCTRKDLVEIFRRLGETAARRGTEIVVEPQSAPDINVINTVQELKDMIGEVGTGNYGILLDLYHMDRAELSVYGSILKAGELIRFVHASDDHRRPPGTGRIPVNEYLSVLAETGYRGYVSVEVRQEPSSEAAARISFETLNYWMEKTGLYGN